LTYLRTDKGDVIKNATAFTGGMLMILGARVANGCTSGHGITGLSQLSIGSLVATPSMFAGGIAAALIGRCIPE
jgi:uncharacterized membrane protein YedE/YeeE